MVKMAAALVGTGLQGPHAAPSALALILLGEKRHVWVLGVGERPIPLNREFLAKVRDHRPLANGMDPKRDDSGELLAYADALAKAYQTPIDALANGARRDVLRTQLFDAPHQYRGETLHMEGKMRLIVKFPAPLLVSYLGIHDLYEVWFFENSYGANPTCALVQELPQGLEPGPQNDVPISVDAYFFKIYRYASRDRSTNAVEREAPLLIGRTIGLITEVPAPASAGQGIWTMSSSLMNLFLVLIAGFVALAAFATWWFRRSDQATRRRLKEVCDQGLSKDKLAFLERHENDLTRPPPWVEEAPKLPQDN